MKVQEQDIYHGPALMQLVEHDSFKALNKADEKYGHYLVNKDVYLWCKYASAPDGPWTFTFQPSDLKAIREDASRKGATHVVLACGHRTICSLSRDEVESLIDLTCATQQWIRVDAPKGKQMRVTGSCCPKTPLLVAHNRFPSHVFEN